MVVYSRLWQKEQRTGERRTSSQRISLSWKCERLKWSLPQYQQIMAYRSCFGAGFLPFVFCHYGIFGINLDFLSSVQGGFFLRKKPLEGRAFGLQYSENAIGLAPLHFFLGDSECFADGTFEPFGFGVAGYARGR